MASAGLLALLDDIATVLDDIAVMTKVASKKTAGLLGDDLALNAEQVSGVRAERELPVVWAVAKGSALNKVILVPAALLLSAFAPWLITPLLMLGGSYLCYEGFEKVFHKFLVKDEAEQHKKTLQAIADPQIDMVAFEKQKIRGAIRTDFILSAEIVVIALGTVQDAPFIKQAMVVTVIAALMTVGVYALVAMIVKLDDVGFHFIGHKGEGFWSGFKRAMGKLLLKSCPLIMKGLSVVGTIAMFLVGGGILIHGLPIIAEIDKLLIDVIVGLPMGVVLSVVGSIIFTGIFGLFAGGVVVAIITLLLKGVTYFQRA